MLWSRESDVLADRPDDLLRFLRSTSSIDRSGTKQDVGFGFSSGVHNSWKFLEERNCFNNDSDFAAHLLSVEMARLDRRGTNFLISFS